MDFIKNIVQIAKDNLDRYEMGYNDLTDERQIIERWKNTQLKLISIESRNVIKSNKLINLCDPDISNSLSMI